MSRRTLGCLGSAINIGGEDAVNNTVAPQRTLVERHTRAMYERRQEVWRTLNQDRVAAFIRLFILGFVDTENGHPLQPYTYKMLKKTLAKGIIPWIHRRLVCTRDERFWPLSMDLFEELDMFMAAHLFRLWCRDQWQMIVHSYREFKKQQQQQEEERRREEQELTEEEASERNYLEWKNSAEYNLNYSNDDD